MNLSEHFTLEEMVKSSTAARLHIDNAPTPAALDNLHELAARLELVRALVGRPLVITSAYRSPALNQAVGGVPTSAHSLGLAADFTSPPAATIIIARQIDASGIDFDQLIDEHDWLHLAIGPQARRQTLSLLPGGGYVEGLR